jgi:Protein of unknown function (DUF429)
MPILSVDLAYRRWTDLGVVILDRDRNWKAPAGSALDLIGPPIHCEIFPSLADPGETGRLVTQRIDPNILAGRLNHLCTQRNIRVLLLDGPQAWKSRHNGLEHARVSERQLNCAAKTGLPGMVKPITYRAFAEFCVDVFDGLCRRGWRRLETSEQPCPGNERVLIESYPHAAWKSLGLKPLPSKRRCRVSNLAEAYAALNALMPFTTNRPPNHDQLQAIVGGIAGLALDEHNAAAAKIVGNPPCREDGQWREGFIVLPLPPVIAPASVHLSGMKWLN